MRLETQEATQQLSGIEIGQKAQILGWEEYEISLFGRRIFPLSKQTIYTIRHDSPSGRPFIIGTLSIDSQDDSKPFIGEIKVEYNTTMTTSSGVVPYREVITLRNRILYANEPPGFSAETEASFKGVENGTERAHYIGHGYIRLDRTSGDQEQTAAKIVRRRVAPANLTEHIDYQATLSNLLACAARADSPLNALAYTSSPSV